MGKKSHHGENIHHMEQVPEERAPPKLPNSVEASGGSLSPSEVKHIREQAAKRHGKNESAPNQA